MGGHVKKLPVVMVCSIGFKTCYVQLAGYSLQPCQWTLSSFINGRIGQRYDAGAAADISDESRAASCG